MLVASVLENTPAAKAGLRAGDCIVEVNGIPITDSGDLRNELRKIGSGEVRVVVVRDRQRIELRALLEPPATTAFNLKAEDFNPGDFNVEAFILSDSDLPELPEAYELEVVPEINIPEINSPEIQLEPGNCYIEEDFDSDSNTRRPPLISW